MNNSLRATVYRSTSEACFGVVREELTAYT